MAQANIWQLKKDAFYQTIKYFLAEEDPELQIKDAIEFSFGCGVLPLKEKKLPDHWIHPLSARGIALDFDPEGAAKKILSVAEDLYKNTSASKEGFLRFWWEIPRKAPEIRKLPAHFYFPVYNLFNVASLASASVVAWPSPSLGIVSMGGVQDFVVKARRTQDLWMGSFMLSWLAWQMLKEVAETLGPDNIIMPHLYDQPLLAKEFFEQEVDPNKMRVANLPNIFSFLLPWGKAEELLKRIKDNLQQKLFYLFDKVRESLENTLKVKFPEERLSFEEWERAAQNLYENLNFFYAVLPFPLDKDSLERFFKDFRSQDEENHSLEFAIKFFEKLDVPRGVGASYVLVSKKAGRYFTQVKLFRPFKQLNISGERCSLCGSFTALFGESAPYNEVRQKFEKLREVRGHASGLKLAGRLRKGEILCPTCLTKRLICEAFFEKDLGIDHHLFPSTADLATAPFKEACLKNWENLSPEIEDYACQVKTLIELTGVSSNSLPGLLKLADDKDKKTFLQADGEWLFEESFDPARIERVYGLKINSKTLEEVKESLKCLKGRIKNLMEENRWSGPRAPGRYFALLAADGDRMGDLLKGPGAFQENPKYWREFFTSPEKLPPFLAGEPFPVSPHYHRFIAERLRLFAMEKAPEIEKQALARLIYAGGDDILLMTNPVHALKLVSYLAEAYKDREIFDGLATISIAVILAHHRTPFHLVTQQVQYLLKYQIKEGLGRNAWGILLMRRSGEHTFLGARFTNQEIIPHLEKIINYFVEGEVSRGVLGNLEALAVGANGLSQETICKTIKYMVQRASKKEALANDFVSLYKALIESEKEINALEHNGQDFDPFNSFLASLKIARFLARED